MHIHHVALVIQYHRSRPCLGWRGRDGISPSIFADQYQRWTLSLLPLRLPPLSCPAAAGVAAEVAPS